MGRLFSAARKLCLGLFLFHILLYACYGAANVYGWAKGTGLILGMGICTAIIYQYDRRI